MPSVFAREEYHSAIRSLGSAKTRLQGLSQPQFSSTPAVLSSNKSALVPEEEYVADDWLEDDLEEMHPKKKRRLRVEPNGIRGEDNASSSAARGQNRHLNADTVCRGNHFTLFYFTPHFFVYFSLILLLFLFFSFSFRHCSSFHLQQKSLSEKERLCEASPGQNDSDARNGQVRKTRGQQVT